VILSSQHKCRFYVNRKRGFTTLFFPCILSNYSLNVPTITHQFNLCAPKSLEGHLFSYMFRWHIYHHHQGETDFTLVAGTPLVRYSPCYAHIVRATPQELISIWHCRHCICTVKVPHQWRPSFQCEIALSLMMVVYMSPKHVGVKVAV
jgi:hypothetical protein